MTERNKNINKLRNKTKKKRDKLVNTLTKGSIDLTQEQRNIICKTAANNYNTFEDKIEEVFKKNKMDIVSTSFNLEKQIVSDLKKAVNPKNVQPNQDFYSYINDRWIGDYELEEDLKYIVQVDDFRLTQHKVYMNLIEIIEQYLTNNHDKKAKCIKNAYESFKKFNTREQIQTNAKELVNYIDELSKDNENVWQLLANFNTNEMVSWGSPFVWSINPDDKNPKVYHCYLESPQITLIDVDVYFDDKEDTEKDKKYKKHYRNKYFSYLKNLFTIVFGKKHGYNVKDVFKTEVEILNAMSCELIPEKNLDADNYNVITKDEAIKNFHFNWSKFCKNLGFKNIPKSFVTSNVNYLLCGTKLLLEKWNSPQWKTYWIYIYIRQMCRWDEKGWKNLFDFQGIFVSGEEASVEKTIKPVLHMSFLFNTFLTNEYISRYNNIQGINYVKTMAEDLKTVFIRIIQRNKWMQPKTKKKALEKLKNFKLTVGSPELLTDDPLLDYKTDDPWGNLVKKAEWRHKRAVELVGKPVIDIPVIDWSQLPVKLIGTQAYVVNASYTPTENGIYIPLGYIQKPFIDLDERGLEYNLSRIGFSIAHEMSHSLDDWGSKYDEFGRLNDWWTEEDKKHFAKIQQDVIKQYETFASYDGIKFDAEPSIGEDLADISGLQICQEYLRDFQLKNEDILPVQSLSFETFYVYFAVQSRQKLSKKAIIAQLKTNPHPPDKYRCNVPLSRTRVFRAIYNVEKGDKMWWHSTNSVWSD
jgi:putative endopeptidase